MSYSPFIISPTEATQMVERARDSCEDNCNCYLIQAIFSPVYGCGALPQSCYKRLPRLINGIPMGAGKLTHHQAQQIKWRYLEGSKDIVTFISSPICVTEAESARTAFREALHFHCKVVFGDVTVKTTIILSQCVQLNTDMFINDIAVPFEEGLHFRDG